MRGCSKPILFTIYYNKGSSILLFRILMILPLLLLHSPAQESNTIEEFWSDLPKEDKLLLTNAGVATGVIAWGFSQWGYGTESFHTDDEGWFQKDTSNGGSDKLGHFYTNYLMTRLMSPIYASWGYDREDAALYGSMTSLMISGLLIEVGDGYSEHGFAVNDLIADSFGVASGYLLYLYPSLASKIDFRFEYDPFKDTGFENQTDFTTDYERMKHLMAIKASGFESLQDTPLKYLELHLGYYSRHFNHDSLPLEGRERTVYVGIGLNLSELLHPHIGKYATFFNYFQPPHTYLEYH